MTEEIGTSGSWTGPFRDLTLAGGCTFAVSEDGVSAEFLNDAGIDVTKIPVFEEPEDVVKIVVTF